MKSIIKLLGVVISFTTFYSCGNGNYKNVTVSGTVLNKHSKLPIENATVKVNCWAYSMKKWESEATEKEVQTNLNGEFKLKFSEGEALDIRVTADNYKDYDQSVTLDRSNFNLKVELIK